MRDERNRIAIERTDAVETERKKDVPGWSLEVVASL